MWRSSWVTLVLIAVGCASSHVDLPAEPSGDGNQGGTAGSGVAGSGGFAVGGAAGSAVVEVTLPPPVPEMPPGPHPAVACSHPVPHATLGGYIDCADGTYRRPTASECVSHLPYVPTSDTKVGSECALDSDCPGEHDYCEWGLCQRGCVSDAECADGQVCFCEEPVGRCVQACCRSDADCPADYPCTGSFGGDWAGFACQDPLDECQTDAECGGGRGQCVGAVPRTCVIMPG